MNKITVAIIVFLILSGYSFYTYNPQFRHYFIENVVYPSIQIKDGLIEGFKDIPLDEEKIELMIFELVNKERRSKGFHSLMLSPHLTQLAKSHSKRMIEEDFFEHSNFNVGENIGETPIRVNVVGCGYVITNEDIAECAVSGWIGSSGHYANMMSLNYANTGVGISCSSSKCRATQTFM